MKKLFNSIVIILFIVFIKCIISSIINEIIIWNDKKNIYNKNLVKTLYILNIQEPYIAYYNEGNILYKMGKYEQAVSKYEKSLQKNPPKKRVCDIRVNLSLSILKQIDSSYIENAYDDLEKAKRNLYNNNCANERDNNGYSREAEKLEEEIEKLQSQLNDFSKDTSNTLNEKSKSEESKDIEKELKEIQKNANANRQKEMDTYENMDGSSYYYGKKW